MKWLSVDHRRTHAVQSAGYLISPAAKFTAGEVVIDRKETTRLIGEILGTLSPEQRVVTELFYYENLSVKEIAEELGVSENTVKSRLKYARNKIEAGVKELEKKGTKLYSLVQPA